MLSLIWLLAQGLPPPPPLIEPLLAESTRAAHRYVCICREVEFEVRSDARSGVRLTAYSVDGRLISAADLDAINRRLAQFGWLDTATLRCARDREFLTISGFVRAVNRDGARVHAEISRERPVRFLSAP